ncbi:MAG: PEGA domain-containing protein [Myxococcota bacterium]|nr:PEGA domain-containing protein [Myxococcota bacterium]
MRMRTECSRAAFICLICHVAAAALAIGCEPAKAPVQPTVSLRIRGAPLNATVIVDEEALGSLEFVAAHGVALPPGVHYVTVKAPGYFPWDREVDAKPGASAIALEVALTKVPD